MDGHMAPGGVKRQRSYLIILVLGLACIVAAQSGQNLLNDKMVQQVKTLFGEQGKAALINWAQFVIGQGESGRAKNRTEEAILAQVNSYFNKKLKFVSDDEHWQKQDYWATPIESLVTQGGDCEDYVIAKYFSLIQAGIDQQKLRITYVKALKLNQAHMVLAYYETPNSVPFILDNLNPHILLATKRRDLAPVYSFNGMGMWIERQQGRSIKVGNASRLSMWMDVLLRMQQQGLQPWLDIPQSSQSIQ